MKPQFKPCAMRCTKEQFEEMRPILEEGGCKIENLYFMESGGFICNNYNGMKFDIGFSYKDNGYNREVFETFSKEKFLNYCGIETKQSNQINNMTTNDFGHLKVGDKVWTLQLGECEVCERDETPKLIKCKNKLGESCWYHTDGKENLYDKASSLFLSNPFESNQGFKERVMWVWDDNNQKNGEMKLVEGFFKGFPLVKMSGQYVTFDHAKEIEPTQIFTEEQLKWIEQNYVKK